MADSLLASRHPDSRIREYLRKQDPTLSRRTCDRILARAREDQRKRLGKTREEHRDDAYSFYTSILQRSNVKPHERIKAQERIDKLLGLESPTRLEMTGKDGGAVQVDLKNVADADLEALERLAASAVDPAAGTESKRDSGGEGSAES